MIVKYWKGIIDNNCDTHTCAEWNNIAKTAKIYNASLLVFQVQNHRRIPNGLNSDLIRKIEKLIEEETAE